MSFQRIRYTIASYFFFYVYAIKIYKPLIEIQFDFKVFHHNMNLFANTDHIYGKLMHLLKNFLT